MITIKYELPEGTFPTGNMAITLSPLFIGKNDSGWEIKGEIKEDYSEWVNQFEATHPIYGLISGDFEDEITADSQEAYEHFIENHVPDVWDYDDI